MSPNTIIVVDVQNGFMTEHTQHLPAAIAAFLEKAGLEHRIFTRFHNPGPGGFYDEQIGWLKMQSAPETNIVPELTDFPTHIIDKDTYSGFSSGELAAYLSDNDITEAYICGADTNVCVTSMAGDLFDRRIVPTVISDLCASHSGADYHQAALKNLEKWVGQKNIIPATQALKTATTAAA